jgi:hypothetical protein
MHRQSGDDDHALIRFDPQAAARIDGHGIGRRRRGHSQGMLGAHARSWSGHIWVRKPPPNLPTVSKSSVSATKKTGQVLVRTLRTHGARKSS